MHTRIKPSLCSIVWWVAFCLLAVPTKSHQYESELQMGELQFSRIEEDDEGLGGALQISDVLRFQLDGASSGDVYVSLFLYEAKERVWLEAGFNKEEQEEEEGGDGKPRFITLTKPLIGHDLLKNNGCGENSLKTHPFTKNRWGEKEAKEKWIRCYLVAVKADDYSIFKTYPDNCVEESRKIKRQGTENPPISDINAEDVIAEDFTSQDTLKHDKHKRSTMSTSITEFEKMKVEDNRKFICRVTQSHMGGVLSLQNGFPTADVKVYYKRNNNADWGSHLLDLQWSSFTNGENKFVSLVAKQHLHEQGVKWTRCFKCEVTINGIVSQKCLGSCTCD